MNFVSCCTYEWRWRTPLRYDTGDPKDRDFGLAAYFLTTFSATIDFLMSLGLDDDRNTGSEVDLDRVKISDMSVAQ